MRVGNVTVSRPAIHLSSVSLGYGKHLNYATLTLAEAITLRNLLNEGIDRYVALYGEADWPDSE